MLMHPLNPSTLDREAGRKLSQFKASLVYIKGSGIQGHIKDSQSGGRGETGEMALQLRALLFQKTQVRFAHLRGDSSPQEM